MNDAPRGAIRNVVFYTQKKDYSALCYGTRTPTDIDGFIDFGGELFVKLELKYEKASMQGGQRLAFERDCDACQSGGVPTYFVVAEHSFSADQVIPVDRCTVIEVRYRGKWKRPDTALSVKEMIDKICKKHGVEVTAPHKPMTAEEAIERAVTAEFVMGKIG